MEIRLDRLGGLIDQFDSTLEFAHLRLDGLTDEEYLWHPAEPCWSVRPRGEQITSKAYGPGGWVLDDEDHDTVAARSIAWLVGHLAAGTAGRWEWTFGGRAADPLALVDFSPLAATGLRQMWDWFARWREGLESLTDEHLDAVGFGQYPGGLDPHIPFFGIVWWVNRETIHHLSEAMTLRDLHAAQG